MPEKGNDWPAAAVAIAILVLIGSVSIAAISSTNTNMTEPLKIWDSLTPLLTLFVGSVGTYFFTRTAVQTAQLQTRNAMAMADHLQRQANTTQLELTRATALLTPEQWQTLHNDPNVRAATPADDMPNGAG